MQRSEHLNKFILKYICAHQYCFSFEDLGSRKQLPAPVPDRCKCDCYLVYVPDDANECRSNWSDKF